jgi:hypothetical protein
MAQERRRRPTRLKVEARRKGVPEVRRVRRWRVGGGSRPGGEAKVTRQRVGGVVRRDGGCKGGRRGRWEDKASVILQIHPYNFIADYEDRRVLEALCSIVDTISAKVTTKAASEAIPAA